MLCWQAIDTLTAIPPESVSQALLAEILEKQRLVSKQRDMSRTLVKSSDVQEAQESVKESIEAVTVLCKKVKQKLDELDSLNAGLLEGDEVGLPCQKTFQ